MANDHSDSEFAGELWKQLVASYSALNFDNLDSVQPWNQWGASTSNHNIVATHVSYPADSDSGAPGNKWGAGTSNHNVVASEYGYSNSVLRSSQAVEREWVLLPEFVIKLILDKVLESIDHVRFAAVCKRWYNLTKDYTERWYDRVRPPMLMLPPPNTQTPTRTLYSISQGVTYNNIQFQLPVQGDVKYYSTERYGCGCGHGWLAKVEINYRENQPHEGFEWHIELINPFRPATISDLHIPPVKLNHDTAPKVILSADPTLNPNNFWVLAFSINGSDFALYDRGHRRWITPTAEREAVFMDAIFYGGQFYVLDEKHGTIVSFDVEKAQVNCLRINNFKAYLFGHTYLVKSTTGDLLYLQRILTSKSNGGVQYTLTKSFKVYKLVFDNRSSSHVDRVLVKNIGDDVIFVGDTPSVAVFAPNFPGCLPNSIYYTDDWMNISQIFSSQRQNIVWDMGIFNLADQTIRHYHSAGEHAHYLLAPLWITPPLPFDPPEKEARKQQRNKARHLWLSCFRTKESS